MALTADPLDFDCQILWVLNYTFSRGTMTDGQPNLAALGSSPPRSFKNIRAWDGSQARAFEELSFQLLKSRAPSDSRAIRAGTPDGGVDWYATLPNGSEWGWQAKQVHGIDALFSAMTTSVRRVVKARPNIVRLIFVISWNLATSQRGGAHFSQRQKFENKVGTWKETVPGAESIDFEIIQESDLLDILAEPEHRGRAWFWWGETVLGAGWMSRRLAEQSEAAGEKYRPDLQVDLPIEDDLAALGAADSVTKRLEGLLRKVVAAGRKMLLAPTAPDGCGNLHDRIAESTKQLIVESSRLVPHTGYSTFDLVPLRNALESFHSTTREARDLERKPERERRQLSNVDSNEEKRPISAETLSSSVHSLSSAASELESWLKSSIGRSLQERMYFLVGPAGSGKTHLFLDSVSKALEEGRPAVVLFGSRFGHSDLWGSVCDQLGLEPVGADVLLGAMDAAGEAAGSGRRFVLFVDALNETVPPNFWANHLPALRAAIARRPHVALAVSCRDSYLDVVDENTARSRFVGRKHPGFAGREVEATQRYFGHYGLEVPRIPLLFPEFRLPLFLRLYCEGLRDSGSTDSAVGHEGRVQIFDRFIRAKRKRIARLLRPAAATGFELDQAEKRVAKVIDALLDELTVTGREGAAIERAEELASAALSGSFDDAAFVLGALQSEGIVKRELLHLGGRSLIDGFRFSFQAFADYLILRRRLERVAEPMSDTALRQWVLEDCSQGIIEAAAVLLPELYGVELPDFLGTIARSTRSGAAERRRLWRARGVLRTVVKTLPYRDAKAISERTVEILDQSTSWIPSEELFRSLFSTAPQPSSRLNAYALHRYLMKLSMPRRDAHLGFATYNEIFEESSPAATLARWAAEGPYPEYDPCVIELACIPLVWLTSSSNRFMRDWVTKALVQLLRGHLKVVLALVNRFWDVDDPYVVQRLMSIAFGALMRSDAADREDASKLAAQVQKLVFTKPVRADEQMLDAARGVVEWGVMHELLPKHAMTAINRPYGLTAPDDPPTKKTLKKKYGFKANQPIEESYSSIDFSIMSMGDFGRYVVEDRVHYFSRYRHGEVYPENEPWGTLGNDTYSADLARRWVFERTVTLGWRPELFALKDGKIGCAHDGQEARKAERWGKKYQWIAYHELLARIADNFQPARRWGDSGRYEGLYQLLAGRDIDPSLPPVNYRDFVTNDGEGSPSWRSPPIRFVDWRPDRVNFGKYAGCLEHFLADTESEPKLDRLCSATDEDGEKWILLKAQLSQGDPSADESWLGLQQPLGLDSWMSPRKQAADLLTHLSELRRSKKDDLVDDGHYNCCYVREIGWTPHKCDSRHTGFETIVDGDLQWQVVSPVEAVTWEGGLLDCSIGKSAYAAMPSTFVQSRSELKLDQRGPSWRDADGVFVFTNYSGESVKRNQALLVRGTWLQTFLEKHDLELLIAGWFERRLIVSSLSLVGDEQQKRPIQLVYSAARIDADLNITLGSPLRELR